MVELTNVCFVVVTIIALVTQVIIPAIKGPLSRLQPELATWLKDQSLDQHAGLFIDSGNSYFSQVASVQEKFLVALHIPLYSQPLARFIGHSLT